MNLRSTHPAAPLAILALVSLATPTSAQDRAPPKRPNLPDEADTNNAVAYYQWGLDRLERSPRKAADAFYWASRIRPSWSDPWYARWAANLLSNRGLLREYLWRDSKDRSSDEMVRNDSLYLRALLLDPFLYRGLDEDLMMKYIREQFDRQLWRAGLNPVDVNQAEVNELLDQFLRENYSLEWSAWRAYMQRDFPTALSIYQEAAGDSDDAAGIHRRMADIFYLVGNWEAAQREIHLTLSAVRQLDDDELVVVYQSKAMLEYALARVFERAGQADSAREAYSRALIEDFSFHPAHVQLANLALAIGDTATGIAELQLAVDIDPHDFIPRYHLGLVLQATGKYEEAAAHFRQIVEVEPFFAQGYLLLAVTLEGLSDGPGALEHYEGFLARARRDDRLRALAEERAETIRTYLGVSP